MIIMLLLLDGIICGAFTSNLAKKKGYSEGIWFAAGFFFSIIGLIAAVGLPLEEDSHQQGPYIN